MLVEDNKDELTIPLSGDREGKWLGRAFLFFAPVLFYGALKAGKPGYSYKFGHVSPVFSFLIMLFGIVLAIFIAIGGIYLVYYRAGVTFNRKSGRIIIWSHWGKRKKSELIFDHRVFKNVSVLFTTYRYRLIKKTYNAFQVCLTAPSSPPLCILPRFSSNEDARRFADKIGTFLGIHVEDRSSTPYNSTPFTYGPSSGEYLP